MARNIEITYVNKSMNKDLPTVFVFIKNEVPTFDTLKDGVVWRTIPNIGRSSSSAFNFPIDTEVRVEWNDGVNKTQMLQARIGKRYTVSKNETEIVLKEIGNASDTRTIDVNNDANIPGGVSASLYKDGKLAMTKKIVGYGQKVSFVLKPKLYWGTASEIQEGGFIRNAILDTDHFFEQDLEGVSKVEISLNGNAEDGYSFRIERQE